uniref:Uncharacterized protein n=1 Tax=Rhizophora mucronata TaxID=61149 RepID=A0A2P2NRK7_RHIMU
MYKLVLFKNYNNKLPRVFCSNQSGPFYSEIELLQVSYYYTDMKI